MGQKTRAAKRKLIVRWTPRRLLELRAELKNLERQVRVVETANPSNPRQA
jgi:hypothetical protein